MIIDLGQDSIKASFNCVWGKIMSQYHGEDLVRVKFTPALRPCADLQSDGPCIRYSKP